MSQLPEGWELIQFDQICDIRDGTHESPKYLEKGIPFITSKHLTDKGIDFTETNYISEKDHIDFSKRSKVDNGDILFGMIGTIGKPTIVNTDFEFSIKNVALLKLSNNEVLSNIYILNLLKSNFIAKQFLKLSNGGVQSFIALGMIRKLKVPLPPLEEQKKIADILSTVDQKIAFVEDNISETEELKKGLMQKLLTEGIGHTEFKDSEVGRIPESWGVKNIAELTMEHKQGYYTKENYVEEGTYLIRITDMYNPKINYQDMPKLKISNNDYELFKVSEGDFLFARSGAIGRYGIVYEDIKAVFGSYIIRFVFNQEKLINEFFGFFYETDKCLRQLSSITQGSSNININANNIKSLKLALPPLEEQKQIAEILSTVDQKLEILKDKKESFEELKKGLMQKLLTGEVRV